MKKLTSKNHSVTQGDCHVMSAHAAALSFAALSAMPSEPLGVAACSFEIDVDAPWQQILPGTDFAAYDGRPHEVPGNKWRIDDDKGQALAAMLNNRAQDNQRLLFDYDHQTLLTKENGQKAPASAWGEKFEWRAGEGLFAQLKFTPVAREHIKSDEYKFYSPVVIYNKATGDVMDIHSVALTNDPAIKGMAQAAALSQQFHTPTPEPKPMNEALALLFGLLGIDVDTSKDIDAAALHAKLTDNDAKTAVAALKARLEANDGDDDKDTEIAALKSQLAEKRPDLSQFVPVKTYTDVVSELASLKAANESITVDQVIEQAQKDGKYVAQGEVQYLKDLGNQNMAALKSLLDGRTAIAALKGKQTADTQKPDAEDKTGVAALSAEQKAVANQLGMSLEDYAKTLADEQA